MNNFKIVVLEFKSPIFNYEKLVEIRMFVENRFIPIFNSDFEQDSILGNATVVDNLDYQNANIIVKEVKEKFSLDCHVVSSNYDLNKDKKPLY